MAVRVHPGRGGSSRVERGLRWRTAHSTCAPGLLIVQDTLDAIKQGKAYYGYVLILGVPYTTGYELIRDNSANIIGIFYVGYKK